MGYLSRLPGQATRNRVTLAVVLVQSFLAAAYLLFFGLLFVYTLHLNTGAPPDNKPLIVSETGIAALTFVVSAALVWLIIWVPGTLIIWLFGGFYAAGDRPAVASGLRNYFLATSAACLIVLLWAIFYAGYTPISVASLITWVIIVVLAVPPIRLEVGESFEPGCPGDIAPNSWRLQSVGSGFRRLFWRQLPQAG